jgi:hypothetical protein
MSDYGTTWNGRAADGYLERVRSVGLTKRLTQRRPWLIAAGVLAGLAAVRRRPWLAGVAALAGVVAARLPKPSSEHPLGKPRTSKAYDATRPLDPDVTVTSMGYPAPPTVTVGPAETPST